MKRNAIAFARKSLSCFGIDGDVRPISVGLDRCYRVRATDVRVFALRISVGYPIRRVSAYQVEAAWIDALSGSRWLRTPELQRTKAGERVAQVVDADGHVLPSTLLEWLPGRRRFRLERPYARALGRGIAALHEHARNHPTPSPDDIKTWDPPFMCSMFRKECVDRFPPDAGNVVERIHANVARVVSRMDASEFGLINADVGVHNIVWHQRLPGFVDFNDSGIGPYAFCLGRLMERIRYEKNGKTLAEELLSGYRDVTPLPPDYESCGGLFELAAALFRMDFSAKRVETEGTRLKPGERRLIARLASGLNKLGL